MCRVAAMSCNESMERHDVDLSESRGHRTVGTPKRDLSWRTCAIPGTCARLPDETRKPGKMARHMRREASTVAIVLIFSRGPPDRRFADTACVSHRESTRTSMAVRAERHDVGFSQSRGTPKCDLKCRTGATPGTCPRPALTSSRHAWQRCPAAVPWRDVSWTSRKAGVHRSAT